MSRKSLSNTRLIEILRKLPIQELNDFYLFLQSPIFTNNTRALLLFSAIRGRNKSTLPDYDALEKTKLFKKVYPKRKAYQEGTFKNVVSDLKKLLEQYLAFSEYQKKKPLQKQLHLEALQRFRIHAPFHKKQKELLHYFDNKIKDPETMLWEFYAKRTVHHHTTIHASRNGNSSLQAMSEALDRFYLSTKLKYLLGKYSWEKMTADRWEAWLEPELLAFLDRQPFEEVPIIYLYHQLVLLLQHNKQTTQFEKIKDYLEKHETLFSEDESRQAYTVLLNYTRYQIKEGETVFIEKAFSIYQHLLKEKIILVNNFLSPHHFNRIVEYSVQCEPAPFFYTEQFLKEYEKHIDQTYREQIMPYNRAMLHFARKEYDKALGYLDKIYQEAEGFFDFYYNLMYRTLRVKVYFENYAIYAKALEAEINRFRQYLLYNTERISSFELEANINFLKMIERLMRRKCGETLVSEEQKRQLKAILREFGKVVEKIWLVRQVELL